MVTKEPKKGRSAITPVRFNATDHAILQKIKEKTGATANSEVLRMALRALAEKHNIKF